MFPMKPIAAALALLACSAAWATADNSYTPRSLLAQAKGLPSDSKSIF